MNCSSSVCRELGGRRAWEAASDLHRYHTPFISDREVDFLECLRAWLWRWRAPLHPGPPVWWCMLRSPLVAALCKYQVYTVYIICPPLYIGLHRYFSRLIFSRNIYANTILTLFWFIITTLCSLFWLGSCIFGKNDLELAWSWTVNPKIKNTHFSSGL